MSVGRDGIPIYKNITTPLAKNNNNNNNNNKKSPVNKSVELIEGVRLIPTLLAKNTIPTLRHATRFTPPHEHVPC